MKKAFQINWQWLIIAFLLVGIFVNNQTIQSLNIHAFFSKSQPRYQLNMILKDSQDPFWIQFKLGADKAANFYACALDTTYLEERGQAQSPFKISELIDKASVSGADGIISFIMEDPQNAQVIDRASQADIPTITLENDVPNSKRASFVGYNAFRFGQEAAKKMNEALAGRGKIAIVMNRNEVAEQDSQNLKISGFLNEINKSGNITVSEYIVSDNGIYGTQDIVGKLLDSENDIDGLFITNSVDTESVAQLLIEYNKVGAYQVVGAGNSEQIKDYTKKRILYASIFVNAYEMGYQCVETLAKIKQGESVPSYIDTTIGVLTPENLFEKSNP